MKSARERAIDIYHAFANSNGQKMSRELIGLIIKETGADNPAMQASLSAIEKQVEADRREVIAWAKEEG
jgi:hypothetical protein